MKKYPEYGIHWFRRDLRIAGNRALKELFNIHSTHILSLFCFDHSFLARQDISWNRFHFFLKTLQKLDEEISHLGGSLLFLDQGPVEAFELVFNKLKKNDIPLPKTISWNKDYEPFAIQRDQKMFDFFKSRQIQTLQQDDHLIIAPYDLQKSDGDGYKVYTPFSRKWLEIFNTPKVKKLISEQKKGTDYLENHIAGKTSQLFSLQWKKLIGNSIPLDLLKSYLKQNLKKVTISIPEAGSAKAYTELKQFKEKLRNYQKNRDFPALNASSHFSLYLKNGSLTTAQVVSYLGLKSYQQKKSGADCFFSELIWREFYYHLIFRHPHVENAAFINQYRHLEFENNLEWFELWKEGKTGFPIVDAGMRQLKTTGWMHNRVRMIVASFLVKDLLIDWRWGERYFMQTLLDGDLAPNNGGWQWAASTGCDAQPYFRIFNPWMQSKKFDPNGDYIKKFIPELSGVKTADLHKPIENHPIYPRPIIDHAVQRLKALELFKILRNNE